MRRFGRKLVHLIALASFLLCAATVVFWVRSYTPGPHYVRLGTYPPDWFGICFFHTTVAKPGTKGSAGEMREFLIVSERGVATFHYAKQFHPLLVPEQIENLRLISERNSIWRPASPHNGAPDVAGSIIPDSGQTTRHSLAVSHWLLMVLTGALPVWSVCRALNGPKRGRAGLCPICSYDLRATPERCPECGYGSPVARS